MATKPIPSDIEKLVSILDEATDRLYEAIELIDRHNGKNMGADGSLSHYDSETLMSMRDGLFSLYKQLFVNTREADVFWLAKNYIIRERLLRG